MSQEEQPKFPPNLVYLGSKYEHLKENPISDLTALCYIEPKEGLGSTPLKE